MDKIIVGIAEGKIAKGDQVLVSYALGSCVGVCLYDWQEHIAGMAMSSCPARSMLQIKRTCISLRTRAYVN